MWWIFGAVLLYLELFGAGLALLIRSLGEKKWYLALIPVYGLHYLSAAAGVFKVLSVPVKKCALFVAELLLIVLLCCLYWSWGIENVVPRGSKMLGQIMLLPVVICYALIYLAVIGATVRIYKRFRVKRMALATILSLLLLPIPFVFIKIRNGNAMPLNEMFD